MIKVKKIGSHHLIAPQKQSASAAGFDLQNAGDDYQLVPGARAHFPTGFAWQIPEGHVGLIWPRSGLASRHGIDILAGCIDSDYRGEIVVILQNHGMYPVQIKAGDRIAQLVILKLEDSMHCCVVDDIDSTDRGENGFGSTGA